MPVLPGTSEEGVAAGSPKSSRTHCTFPDKRGPSGLRRDGPQHGSGTPSPLKLSPEALRPLARDVAAERSSKVQLQSQALQCIQFASETFLFELLGPAALSFALGPIHPFCADATS